MFLCRSGHVQLYVHYTWLSYICYIFVQAGDEDLVVQLSVEGHADGLKQQACVFVVGCVGMDGDVHTGSAEYIVNEGWLGLRVVVDLDLGEQRNLLGRETEAHVSVAISRGAGHALPFLDAR